MPGPRRPRVRVTRAAVWTVELAARQWPYIRQPPHAYYDVRNKGGLSPFPPGQAPAFYDPFLQFFAERAQTAAAQARLYERKRKGEDAEQWRAYERGWLEAARVARHRQEQAEKGQGEPLARLPFEWDDDDTKTDAE